MAAGVLSLRRLVLPLLALSSFIMTALYVRDLLVTNSAPTGCAMTYSPPVYTLHPMPTSTSTDTAAERPYELYAVHMKKARTSLTGVPVLFLPGHMGSFKQSRSLARHLTNRDDTLFDVFAIDFQEELSALHGRFVDRQAAFVNAAVRVILKAYKKQARKEAIPRKVLPDSVVIVAHSMGGVVARVAQLLPSYKRHSIRHVIALGTPFAEPPFPFDAEMQRVYATLQTPGMAASAGAALVSSSSSSSPSASPVSSSTKPTAVSTFISISGGYKDTTVHASQSVTDRLAGDDVMALSLLSSLLPTVAPRAMDHLCLLWCYELIDRVAGSLLAIVDRDARDWVKAPERRLALSRSFLLNADHEGNSESHEASHQQGLYVGGLSSTTTSTTTNPQHHRDVLWMPEFLVRLFRTRYMTLLWIMFVLVVHILYLQLARWQNRFDPTQQASLAATKDAFPSLTSVLHPMEHTPEFIRHGSHWLVTHLPPFSGPAQPAAYQARATAATRMTAPTIASNSQIAVALALIAVVAGVALEAARRHATVMIFLLEVLELVVLYLDAVGLLYMLSMLLSLVRVLLYPLVRVMVSIARRARLQRWMGIALLYVVVFILLHTRDFELLPLNSLPRHLSVLVIATALVFIVHVLELGLKNQSPVRGGVDELTGCTPDQMRYRQSLFALLTLSSVSWVGHLVFFLDVARSPPSSLSSDLVMHALSSVAILLLGLFVVRRTETEMLPLPPSAFFDVATEDDLLAGVSSSSSASSSSTLTASITAETCPRCVFEDGGPGAIFVEYCKRGATQRMRMANEEVVVLGPSFRVVSCDCVFRFQQPRAFCSFCTRSCRLCGGGSGNYQQAQRYQEYVNASRTQVTLHALVALVMELMVWAVIVVPSARAHYMAYMTVAITVLLAGYHAFLRHPIETRLLRKQQRKRVKKLDVDGAKARKKSKAKKSKARKKSKPTTGSDAESNSNSSGKDSFMSAYGAASSGERLN